MDQIHRGDPAGQEVLYRHLLSGARLFLRRRLGSSDVDDRVHDLFLTLVETIRRDGLREPERLMGFVRTVLYRQLSQEVSRMVTNRETVSGIETASQLCGAGLTPEQQLLADEKITLMKQVLRKLKERDFEALTRAYLRNQTAEQICTAMELTPTQLQLVKSRAKARLAHLMRRKLARKPFNQQ